MNKTSRFYRFNLTLTYYSLMVLAVGAFTSISILALSHILIFPPAIYFSYLFFKDRNYKLPASQLALLGLCATIIISAIINWNNLVRPSGTFKFKYFLLSGLGIFAYQEAFKSFIDFKKKKLLLNLFLISTTIATISGLVAIPTGFNYLSQRPIPFPGRATGLNGMIMTYAYGLSLFMILLTGLIIIRKKIQEYISTKLLIIHWIINFLGLYLSYARGAWLGFFLAFPLLFWTKNKRFFWVATTLSLLILGLSLNFNPKAKDRFLNSTDSNQERIAYFQTAFYAFKENPIFGLGYNNFEPNVVSLKHKYNLNYRDLGGKAHNNFLEFLASTGIIGFTFLVLFHFFWAWEGRKSSYFGDINFVFVISLIISGMVQHTLADGSNLFFIMGYYAIYTSITYYKKSSQEDVSIQLFPQTDNSN